MTFDDDTRIIKEQTYSYRAAFDCGHSRWYEAANVEDVEWLQDLASRRLCPECAYKIGSESLVLRTRVAQASWRAR